MQEPFLTAAFFRESVTSSAALCKISFVNAATANQRKCVFCDTPLTKANSSREDTIPKWLQAELGIANAKVEPTLTAPTGEQLAQRIHPVDQLLTGGVCQTCNNGWMSDLEKAAKSVLGRLMRAEVPVAELKRADRRTVARWAAKTAYMIDLGGLESRVPVGHVKALYANDSPLPEGVYVFARQQPRTRPWYYAGAAWWKHGQLTSDAREQVEERSYKIALQFGDLILIVVFWPLQRWGIRVEANKLALVWPPTAVIKQYVHPEPQDVSECDAACRLFAITIGVVPHRGAEGYLGPAPSNSP